MKTLVEVLEDPARRKAVVEDGVQLIEDEVGSKSGLTGMALKAGYKTVKKIQPGIIAGALVRLLPDFAPRVDPFYAQAQASGDVKAWFTQHAGEIADALLAVTDEKAKAANNRVMIKVYQSLRGQARTHTMAAVPRLATLIERHVG